MTRSAAPPPHTAETCSVWRPAAAAIFAASLAASASLFMRFFDMYASRRATTAGLGEGAARGEPDARATSATCEDKHARTRTRTHVTHTQSLAHEAAMRLGSQHNNAACGGTRDCGPERRERATHARTHTLARQAARRASTAAIFASIAARCASVSAALGDA